MPMPTNTWKYLLGGACIVIVVVVVVILAATGVFTKKTDSVCPDNCSNKGTCTNGICTCNTGYSGVNCSTPLGCVDNCSNKGTCTNGICTCNTGYSGVNCSTPVCLDNCSNKGTCNNGICTCNTGYSGDNCSTSSGGANNFVPPDNNTGSDSTPPINQEKMIRLYLDTDFNSEANSKPLMAGMETILAKYNVSKYDFLWKSMKVEDGTKIMFSRYIGGGNTRHSFAVGKYNVKNLEDWVRTYARISGTGNWGYGSLTIDRFGTYETNDIFIKILNDAEWEAAIISENAGCNSLMSSWNSSSPGKYSAADCESINLNTFKTVYTM
jgi:hypothetical protein